MDHGPLFMISAVGGLSYGRAHGPCARDQKGDFHRMSIVRYDIDGFVATVTMDSPQTRNGISRVMTDGIVEALSRADADVSVRCVVLTGSGTAFCAGGDLRKMRDKVEHFAGDPVEIRRTYVNGVQRLARLFDTIEVPIIAAVNGPAMGAGLDLAMMCDMRLCAESAIFAESFVRLGLVSAAGGTWFLARHLPAAVVAELVLTGDTIDAADALRLGIVSRVMPDAELATATKGLAARIARHAPEAVRLNKRLLRIASRADLATTLDLAASMQGGIQHTLDHDEAIAAALDKRDPVYGKAGGAA